MPPLVIAHRGDSSARPENTLLSFASALEAGAALVEFDVQLTRDRQIVVIHDPSVDRTTDGRGAVKDLTLAEIRKLSAGYPQRFGAAYRGERVPTLAEVLGFLKGRARALVEIKHEAMSDDADAGIEALTVAAIRRQEMQHQAVILAFHPEALRRCRRHGPEIVRGHLFHDRSPADIVAGALDAGAPLVLPHKSLLSDDLAARCAAASLKVATWVVDDPEELQSLQRFDLYGIGTNRPAAILEALLPA